MPDPLLQAHQIRLELRGDMRTGLRAEVGSGSNGGAVGIQDAVDQFALVSIEVPLQRDHIDRIGGPRLGLNLCDAAFGAEGG